ncbi:hypothetical protein JYQ62_02195 [Nostoc sp. UHCC 0702]|nr:hypothetical protein JYQ62_02195 [Nostoc sp. UHCC 0702]
MISYSQLYSWRNLCEFLDSCWYNFAEPYEIKKGCKCLPNLYNPTVRFHREYLFDNHLIQFIHWTRHPVLRYHSSRSYTREFKKTWGWQLCREWEHKINYLENLLLFGTQTAKPWETDLMQRMQAREQRKQKLILKAELLALPKIERMQKIALLNICWRCYEPILPLMVDCVSCGATAC